MTSRYRHRRTPLASTPFPNPIEPGEIAVNTANRQIAVGDASTGVPKQLIGVRFFDVTSSYVLNDVVTQGGKIYRANGNITPGVFNVSQWTDIGASASANLVTFVPVGTVSATDVQSAIAEVDAEKAPIASPTFSGDPKAPTPAPGDNDTSIATTAFVKSALDAKSSLYISDTPPAGVPDGSLWWETDGGNLYLRYNDGDSTQWVIATSIPDVGAYIAKSGDTMTGQLKLVTPPVAANDAAAKSYVDGIPSVRYDAAQALTAAQQLQARSNIAAAPFDAMAYGGLQINGGFQVSQELGTTGRTTSGYICDGWQLGMAGTMAATAFQNANPSLPGFSHWLAMTITGVQASLGTGDYCQIFQPIEGYRTSRLAWGTANAQPITIGFWTAHTPAGLYTGSIRNKATNRAYAFTYTHAIAASWQYNTVTIPGDTTGTWATDNTIGLYLTFVMAAGSSFTAPSANTWLAGNYAAAPGQINGVATMSNGFCLTGVSVHPGSQAPSAAQSAFIARPFDQELQTCKRYYQSLLWPKTLLLETGYMTGGGGVQTVVFFNPEMRAVPVCSIVGAWLLANSSLPFINTVTSSPNSIAIQGSISATGSWSYTNYNVNGAGLIADARL